MPSNIFSKNDLRDMCRADAEVSGCDLIVGVVSVEALAYCKMGTLGCILEKSSLPVNLFSQVKATA